jgi:hypothetical protein
VREITTRPSYRHAYSCRSLPGKQIGKI